jgi:hypothetical protein
MQLATFCSHDVFRVLGVQIQSSCSSEGCAVCCPPQTVNINDRHSRGFEAGGRAMVVGDHCVVVGGRLGGAVEVPGGGVARVLDPVQRFKLMQQPQTATVLRSWRIEEAVLGLILFVLCLVTELLPAPPRFRIPDVRAIVSDFVNAVVSVAVIR